jgi:hypothetical protein
MTRPGKLSSSGVWVYLYIGAEGVVGWGPDQDLLSVGVSIFTPTLSPLRNTLVDATGYPHTTAVRQHANTPYTIATSARSVPHVPIFTVTKS